MDKKHKETLNYYLDNCCGEFSCADDKKVQENRLKPLIKKLTDDTSVYKDLPFSFLSIEERCKFIVSYS